MQFGQLLRKRLSIAAAAAQADNDNSETLKAVLAVAVQCITQQANALELLEAEVAEKVSENELKQALGQKLSLREFLGYFQKVEKIVEKMEMHWASGQTRTQQLLQGKIDALSSEIQHDFQEKMSSFERKIKNRQIQLQQAKIELAVVREAVDKLEYSYLGTLEDFKKKIDERMSENEQYIRSSEGSSHDKISKVLGEVKQMQLYLNQTHSELNQLMGSLVKEGRISNECTEIEVEARLAGFQTMLMRVQERVPSRWMWQSRPQSSVLEWSQLSGKIFLQALGQSKAGIRIQRSGLYKITLGYILSANLQGELILSVQFDNFIKPCGNRDVPSVNAILLPDIRKNSIPFIVLLFSTDRFFVGGITLIGNDSYDI